MFSNLRWRLVAFARKIWVRAVLYSFFGIAAALVSYLLGGFMQESVAKSLGGNSVETILQVLATSMLSVTIFAVSTLVGALSSASSNASPRAARLVVEDPTAQSILASFLGVFMFSLVGIIALSSGLYGSGERFILFLFTIVLVGIIVASLISWITHITTIGRLEDTNIRLERAAVQAFKSFLRDPHLGGTPWDPQKAPTDKDAIPIFAKGASYVRYFDIDAFAKHFEPEVKIWVLARPGAFVGPNRPLAMISSPPDGKEIPLSVLASARDTWVMSETRHFDQDPRFGFCVLAEVASKALSSAINDPGTAIDILGRITRVISVLDQRSEPDIKCNVRHFNIFLKPLTAIEVIEDAFRPIARDGAGVIEVGLRLQAVLGHIAMIKERDDLFSGNLGEAAVKMSKEALVRAESTSLPIFDLEKLRSAASHLLMKYGLSDD